MKLLDNIKAAVASKTWLQYEVKRLKAGEKVLDENVRFFKTRAKELLIKRDQAVRKENDLKENYNKRGEDLSKTIQDLREARAEIGDLKTLLRDQNEADLLLVCKQIEHKILIEKKPVPQNDGMNLARMAFENRRAAMQQGNWGSIFRL